MKPTTKSQPIQVRIAYRPKGKKTDTHDSFQRLAEKVKSNSSFEGRNNWISFTIESGTEVESFFTKDLLDSLVEDGTLTITLKRQARGTDFQEELTLLESKGFTRRGQNVRLLKKFDGEMETVLEILEARKAPNDDRNSKFKEEQAILAERGFTQRGKNFGLLNRFNGDVEEVVKCLQAKKCVPGWKEKEEQYASELSQLEEMGFHKRPQNLRLLSRFDGDVDQVSGFLMSKTKKCGGSWRDKEEQYTTELSQLEEMGFHKKPQNLRLLSRFDGDVDQVSSFLMAKTKKCGGGWRDKEEQYASELSQLEEMGFDKKTQNLRLLNRFNGDIDRVTRVLLSKQNRERKGNKFQEDAEKYQIHLNVLRELGHSDNRLNMRLLRQFDGDLKQVVPELQKKGNDKLPRQRRKK